MITVPMDQMLYSITTAIERKKPLSIVRYGDGEAGILNGFNDLDNLKAILNRQLGLVPPVEQIQEIQSNLITAYQTADVIGIPVNKRLDNPKSYWYRAFSILVEHVGIDVIQSKDLTSIDFHSYMLDHGQWNTLLKKRGTLIYISCRDLTQQFKSSLNIHRVHGFHIAPEMKFTSGYEGPPHFPTQFNAIRRWMDIIQQSIEGNLCLFGAGYVGKIYGTWFKERGGIAVDAGCMFDAWAGKLTRGKERGMDKTDTSNALL